MINTYTQEYIEEHMDDFKAFVDAVYKSKYHFKYSVDTLAILYISMKRPT